MTRHHFMMLCALLGLVLPQVASAAETKVEITPFAGYRFQGEFDSSGFDDFFNPFDDLTIADGESYGVVVDFALGRAFMLELILSHQESELALEGFFFDPDEVLFDVDVDYYHVGFLYRWTPGQIHPFFGISAGISRLDAQGEGGGSFDRPSVSIGGGAKFFFTDHFGIRLEGRGFWTFIDDDVSDVCDCGFRDDSVFLVQPEVRAGLIFAF